MNGKDLSKFSALLNNQTYINYYNRLKLIATSLFSWEGLEEIGGDSRFLEQALYEYGRACFVKDPELGYLTVRANPSDTLNIYNLPTKINAWSIGYSKQFDLDEVVYIMNNELMLPTDETIRLFSYRLYETERTMDVNLKSLKTPILLEGDTKSILTLKNVYQQYDGNQPVIFGNKNFDITNKLNVLKTESPYLIDKLMTYKHDVWNECMTFLGINNANTDKKERLITDEVNSNDELIKFYLNCFYKTRKKACDEINKKFFGGDEKIKIKVNTEFSELINSQEFDIIKSDNEVEYNDNEEGDFNE